MAYSFYEFLPVLWPVIQDFANDLDKCADDSHTS